MVEYDLVNVPIVDIVNQIILYASQNRASDIHMDPREDFLMIRMRIDGELRNHTKIPKAYERNLITRLKLISNMNITETRLPQDGSIKGKIEGRDLDMRVSVLPTNEGEKVVIRILDYSKSLSGIGSLGFSKKNFALLEKMLGVPNGIILVTGATGSGKSTTTYSMLQELNKENTNIITVEDPIEMNIEGINQVQVNSEIGLTFAAVLRSILRQDPNVILIGEIRDSETAQIAVRASITGHLVLSTLHTNNSLSTIERLLDMDVERYLLSSALTGIISQKLARKLCPKCRKIRATTEYEKELFELVLNRKIDQVYDAAGCEECTEGYRGRIAIEEVLYINDTLRSVISNPKTTKSELKELVYTDEVTTLLGDGLEKILEGNTSFKELFKLIEVDLEMKTLRENASKKNYKNTSEITNQSADTLIIEEPAYSEDIIIDNEPEEASSLQAEAPTTMMDVAPTEVMSTQIDSQPQAESNEPNISLESSELENQEPTVITPSRLFSQPVSEVPTEPEPEKPVDNTSTLFAGIEPKITVGENINQNITPQAEPRIEVMQPQPHSPLQTEQQNPASTVVATPQATDTINTQPQITPQTTDTINTQPQITPQATDTINTQPQITPQPTNTINTQPQVTPQTTNTVNAQPMANNYEANSFIPNIIRSTPNSEEVI